MHLADEHSVADFIRHSVLVHLWLCTGDQTLLPIRESAVDVPKPKPPTSWIFQTRVLTVRFARSWYRSPHLLLSFLAQYLFAGVFLGKD